MASFRTAADRLYRRLLALYPGEFRSAYGDQMALVVRDRSRREPLIPLFIDLILDTVRTAPREHLAMWSQDVRYALRMMTRSPGFTLVAAGSLALGIGANAAIFSFADALLLRPLPIARPSEVVSVRSDTQGAPLGAAASTVSYRDYRDFRDRTRAFDGLVAYNLITAGLAPKADAVPALTLAMLVSGNMFHVLGVEPTLGRGFRPEEDVVEGRDAVAVISDGTWQRVFAADPGIIGQTLRLNGVTLTIVGVAPASFTGMDQYVRPAVFVPLAMAPALIGSDGTDLLQNRSAHALAVKGRLRPGVSVTRAEGELAAIAASIAAAYPETNRDQRVKVRTELQTRMEASPPDTAIIAMLMGLVACVLLIACANVANLLLSRSGARAREIAIRLSVGASRTRLVRQLLTESLMLALLASGLGLLLAWAGVWFFSQVPIPTDLPVSISVRLDYRVFIFSLAVSVASVVLFGLAPALRGARTDLVTALKANDSSRMRSSRLWGRKGLVVVQVALALVLLVTTASLFRGVDRLLRANAGFRKDHILLASFDPTVVRYAPDRVQAFYRDLTVQAHALPGVTSVAMTSSVPMSNQQESVDYIPEGVVLPPGKEALTVFGSTIDPDYFATLHVPIVKGRAFSEHDTASSQRVVIVNEVVADRYWPGQDPIGKRVRLNGPGGPWAEIVGVARAHKYLWIGEPPTEFIYQPFAQHNRQQMTLVLESQGDPSAVAGPLRTLAGSVDANVPMYDVRTLEALFFLRAVSVSRMLIETVAVMGTLGLILAVMGLYALIAYAVGRRTREIGIRMAIGASRRSVLTMVLKQGLSLAAIGVTIGLVASIIVIRTLAAVIAGVSVDSVGLVALPLGLIGVTLLATLVPARRAARIDPVNALRQD